MKDMNDIFMVYIIVEKLDRESLKQWKTAHAGTDHQRYDQLYRFLQTRCRALEAASVGHDGAQCGGIGPSEETKIHNNSSNKGKSHSLSVNQNKSYCCEDTHKVFQCKKFRDPDVDSRRDLVNQKKTCLNCLQQRHFSKQCQSKSKCKTCGATHNTLLHEDKPESGAPNARNDNVNAFINNTYQKRQVLLQTGMIDVLKSSGKPVRCRALFDSGYQLNLITN